MWRIAVTVAVLIVAFGCSTSKKAQPPAAQSNSDLVFLTTDGCANTSIMRANLDAALRAMGRPVDYAVIDLGTVSADDVRAGYGTPTVLYKGRDLFGMPEPSRPNPDAT